MGLSFSFLFVAVGGNIFQSPLSSNKTPCEKIIASLWQENSSRDLKTELCARFLEQCSRSDSRS